MNFSFAGGTQKGNVFGIEVINIVFLYLRTKYISHKLLYSMNM